MPLPGWDHRLETQTPLENSLPQIATARLVDMQSEAYCLVNVPWACQG